jgi:hypothetical protein
LTGSEGKRTGDSTLDSELVQVRTTLRSYFRSRESVSRMASNMHDIMFQMSRMSRIICFSKNKEVRNKAEPRLKKSMYDEKSTCLMRNPHAQSNIIISSFHYSNMPASAQQILMQQQIRNMPLVVVS